jgi:hypothetical protein
MHCNTRYVIAADHTLTGVNADTNVDAKRPVRLANCLPAPARAGPSCHRSSASSPLEGWSRNQTLPESADGQLDDQLHHLKGHVPANHPDLRQLSDAEIAEECESADTAIAARLGRSPRYFAYPFGYCDARVRALLRPRYAAAVTTELRPLRRDEDMAALPRLDTYYLQHPWLQGNLATPPTRAYLALRRLGRRLRHGG